MDIIEVIVMEEVVKDANHSIAVTPSSSLLPIPLPLLHQVFTQVNCQASR